MTLDTLSIRKIPSRQDFNEPTFVGPHSHQAVWADSALTEIGTLAHDLKNELLGVSGCITLATDDLAPDSPTHATLAAMQASSARAIGLLERLLARLRGVHEQAETPLAAPLDLVPLVTDLVPLLLAHLGQNISLDWQPQYGPVLAHINTDDFTSILLNLVLNARDAMPRGGVLTICVEGDAGGPARISVSDTGVGMSERLRARLFRPFTTTKSRGTGLGLASSAAIAARYGGTINVDSSIGGGTTVVVDLPAPEAL
ncbi:MAG TPA: HAMP domain-containing sensor histidine kinase [Roseiflexaceae bacterium]|nr:HAMP domain-containing sensor histidine kinase [Roseiflexaceae bacterium]